MSEAPAILSDPRERWLAERRHYLTASDIAAVLGEDKRRSPLQVYLAKVEGIESRETLPMKRGRRFEAAIADEYAEQTGRPVGCLPPYELVRHPTVPFLAATPDRKVLATAAAPDPFGKVDVGPTAVNRNRAPLQIKMALGSASDWKEEPPLAYAVQVTIEMACLGAEWGALCGMIGPGPLRTFDIPRSDAFLDAALPHLETFWLRVRRREPPEADGLPGTRQALRLAFPDEDGETIPLDIEATRLADEWEAAKRQAGDADDAVREIESKLRLRMGSASFGALIDGTYLALPKQKRAAYTVGPTEFRVLRRFRPKVRRR
jgi:putative phage-type endonuclease